MKACLLEQMEDSIWCAIEYAHNGGVDYLDIVKVVFKILGDLFIKVEAETWLKR